MKERLLYEDDFEKHLREKADQFKMYPSDKVWNNVYSSIHTRRRRFVAGMTVLIGGILVLAGSELIFPSKNISKIVATKPAVPVNVGSAEGLQKYTAASFSSVQATTDQKAGNNNITAAAPFVNYTDLDNLNSSDKISVNSISEITATAGSIKNQPPSASKEKVNQPEGISANENAAFSLSFPALSEKSFSSFNNINAGGELNAEKSITQLPRAHNDRLSWEIHIAPTWNTHYLTAQNPHSVISSIQNAPIMVVHFSNVNGFVDNTPAMGYDVGGNLIYKISRTISLKAGLEFNYSRYYIRAYNSNPSQASAVLNSYLGYIADSLVNYANTNTSISKNPQRIQNKYYQLSMPIGIDMKVLGKDKLQLHLGATVQPSYLLNHDSYVLSDDYNSYVKEPQAFRKWNLGAGAELFLSYQIGKIRWEFGPMVRYQIYSTYKTVYPVSENMLNYGIRIGFSKSIW